MAGAGVASQKKAGVFYGYWIVVAAFLIFFVNSGASFYSFGLFVTPLEKALGWTRSEIMFGNTLLGIALRSLAQGIHKGRCKHDLERRPDISPSISAARFHLVFVEK